MLGGTFRDFRNKVFRIDVLNKSPLVARSGNFGELYHSCASAVTVTVLGNYQRLQGRSVANKCR